MDFKIKHSGKIATFGYTRSEAPDPRNFEWHCHSNYELLYVVEGEGKYVVEGEEFPLADNSALIMHPYQYHYVELKRDSPYERYVINFNKEDALDAAGELDMLLPDTSGGRVYFPRLEFATYVRASLDSFVSFADKCGENEDRFKDISMRAAITQTLLLLSRESVYSSAVEDDVVLRVISYVNRNLTSPLSLDGLAREFYVSKYHLCRSFRRQVGASIFEYIATKRHALAESYLEGGMSAAEVAERVGYTDYSAFYRSYVKRAGHSPVRGQRK